MNTREGFAFIHKTLEHNRRAAGSPEHCADAIRALRDIETELKSVRADLRRAKRFRENVTEAMKREAY
jgi:hypothetical protein